MTYLEETTLPEGFYKDKRVACVGPLPHSMEVVDSYDLVVRYNGHWKSAEGRTDVLYINSQKLYKEPKAAGISTIVHRPLNLHKKMRLRFRIGMFLGMLSIVHAYEHGAKEIYVTGMDFYRGYVEANKHNSHKRLIHGIEREGHLDALYLLTLYIPILEIDARLRDILQSHLFTPNLL